MNELELVTKKRMHNRIFHTYVYSTMLSIYYADIAHDRHTIHNIIYMYIYCGSDESFMWGNDRLGLSQLTFSIDVTTQLQW